MISDRHEALERMPPVQKIRHWAGASPWEGIRLDHTTVVGSNAVLMDGGFHITGMPLLVGKPCFGQPTAFARHGGPQPIFHPVRGFVPSRCMRCSTKEMCERTAKMRLRATPEIRDAHLAFERAGGSFGLKNQADFPAAQRQFNSLVHTLMRHGGFTSTNDAAVLAHYKEERARAREAAAKRKRAARYAAAKKGELDPTVCEILHDHRRWREAQLRLAIKTRGAPPRISKLPPASARVTADAWLGRVILTLRRLPVNASSVAKEMMTQRPEHYRSHNVLRQRVLADLLRVDQLERYRLPDTRDPLWPKFDLRSALDDADHVTHYLDLAA